jgi:hypothetical protein
MVFYHFRGPEFHVARRKSTVPGFVRASRNKRKYQKRHSREDLQVPGDIELE